MFRRCTHSATIHMLRICIILEIGALKIGSSRVGRYWLSNDTGTDTRRSSAEHDHESPILLTLPTLLILMAVLIRLNFLEPALQDMRGRDDRLAWHQRSGRKEYNEGGVQARISSDIDTLWRLATVLHGLCTCPEIGALKIGSSRVGRYWLSNDTGTDTRCSRAEHDHESPILLTRPTLLILMAVLIRLNFLEPANLWVKPSWFLAEPYIPTDGRTDRGGTGNTVIIIQSGLAYFGSIPKINESVLRLRARANWEVEKDRHEFLHQLYPLLKNWKGQLPHLRDIFQPEEIDWILSQAVKKIENDRGQRIIEFLVDTGYKDEPKVDKNGRPSLHRTTPVHHVARRDRKVIGKLIQNTRRMIPKLFNIYNRFDVNYIDELGFTHFHVACLTGCYDVVEKFLKLGQDANCFTENSVDPPLHLALIHNRKEVLRLLLEYKADPNLLNTNELAALHIICKKSIDDYVLANMLFEFSHDQYKPLQVNVLDKSGDSLLHVALSRERDHLFRLLLRNGADPNLANAEGLTPLQMICQEKNADKLLEELFDLSYDQYQPVQVNAQDRLADLRANQLPQLPFSAHQLVVLQIEDEQFGRTGDGEVVDRSVDAAVEDPQPVALIGAYPVDRYQFGAVEVTLAGAVPLPAGVGLQVGRAAPGYVARNEAQGGRHSGAQSWCSYKDAMPADLQAGRHDVLRLELLEESRIVGEDVVEQRPLGHRLKMLAARQAEREARRQKQQQAEHRSFPAGVSTRVAQIRRRDLSEAEAQAIVTLRYIRARFLLIIIVGEPLRVASYVVEECDAAAAAARTFQWNRTKKTIETTAAILAYLRFFSFLLIDDFDKYSSNEHLLRSRVVVHSWCARSLRIWMTFADRFKIGVRAAITAAPSN
ncbi:unnamed protein product [Trichogramma brassicae]|uniref:Uncharacterized protein n=1 Tax=Trichogramma brassicae TaxID=86971 RepID=A0A6H5JAD6_9HYME|nr:unnamed protein product [Trichogramma brassicae]